MPTPRPISAAMVGAMELIDVRRLISPIVSIEAPRAKTAASNGMAIASSDPKASNSTMAAARRPTPALPLAGFSMSV